MLSVMNKKKEKKDQGQGIGKEVYSNEQRCQSRPHWKKLQLCKDMKKIIL